MKHFYLLVISVILYSHVALSNTRISCNSFLISKTWEQDYKERKTLRHLSHINQRTTEYTLVPGMRPLLTINHENDLNTFSDKEIFEITADYINRINQMLVVLVDAMEKDIDPLLDEFLPTYYWLFRLMNNSNGINEITSLNTSVTDSYTLLDIFKRKKSDKKFIKDLFYHASRASFLIMKVSKRTFRDHNIDTSDLSKEGIESTLLSAAQKTFRTLSASQIDDAVKFFMSSPKSYTPENIYDLFVYNSWLSYDNWF